jgi:hypothetical protein
VLAASGGSIAWAGWGCAAKARDGAMGRVWAAETEGAARRDAVKYCADGGHKGCKVIGCSNHVDTQAEAHAVWESSGKVTKCHNATADKPCRTGYIGQ